MVIIIGHCPLGHSSAGLVRGVLLSSGAPLVTSPQLIRSPGIRVLVTPPLESGWGWLMVTLPLVIGVSPAMGLLVSDSSWFWHGESASTLAGVSASDSSSQM